MARGSGTGLAGGAVPLDGAVVVSTTRLAAIRSVDPVERVAWVEPGVINLDLSRALAPLGLHFAPDPSSQQACSIGGNVANNAGGPHCLAYGVTSAHVLAVEVVLPDGTVTVLGDPGADVGLDLRGVFVGSGEREGAGGPEEVGGGGEAGRELLGGVGQVLVEELSELVGGARGRGGHVSGLLGGCVGGLVTVPGVRRGCRPCRAYRERHGGTVVRAPCRGVCRGTVRHGLSVCFHHAAR